MTKTIAAHKPINAEAEIVPEDAIEALIAGARQVTEVPFVRMKSSADAKRINGQELLAIYSVLAYVAHNQNERQELVQNIVETQFHVDHIAKLPQRDFQRAMEFLIDLRMDEIRSKK